MGEDASEIRREIEETRARMGETVEAIGYKADVPARVKDNVNERLDTIKGSIGNVVDTVRTRVATAADAVTGAAHTVAGSAGGAAHNVAGTTADAATTGFQRGMNVAGNVAGNVAEGAAEAARGGQQQAQRAVSLAKSNPLGLALGALALGLIGGLLLPRTDLENEQLGPVRDRLKDQIVDKAQTAIGEAVESGKQAVSETLLNAAASVGSTGTSEHRTSTTARV